MAAQILSTHPVPRFPLVRIASWGAVIKKRNQQTVKKKTNTPRNEIKKRLLSVWACLRAHTVHNVVGHDARQDGDAMHNRTAFVLLLLPRAVPPFFLPLRSARVAAVAAAAAATATCAYAYKKKTPAPTVHGRRVEGGGWGQEGGKSPKIHNVKGESRAENKKKKTKTEQQTDCGRNKQGRPKPRGKQHGMAYATCTGAVLNQPAPWTLLSRRPQQQQYRPIVYGQTHTSAPEMAGGDAGAGGSLAAFDVRAETLANQYFRRVACTYPDGTAQVVLHTLRVGEDLGLQAYPQTDAFVRIEGGSGQARVGNEWVLVGPGAGICVPRGLLYNIVNDGGGADGTTMLQFSTVFSGQTLYLPGSVEPVRTGP